MTMNTKPHPETTTETDPMPASASESETINNLRAEIGELRLRAARESVVRRLEAAGARSPEVLFPAVTDKLQFADDGSVENATALVELLKRDMPEQFGTAPPAASVDGGSGVSSGVRPLTREALAKMSPEQISRLDWAAVRQVLSRS